VTSQPAYRMHSYHVHYTFRLSFRFDFLKQFICVCIIYAELHFNISKEIWQTNWFPNCNAWRILNTAFHSPGKYSPELCGRALSGLQWSTANVSRSNSAGDRVSLEHWSQVRRRKSGGRLPIHLNVNNTIKRSSHRAPQSFLYWDFWL